MSNLTTVAMNECHLVWSWEDFRLTYQRVNNLRHIFWNVFFICLSITLIFNIVAYIHEVCNFKRSTVLFSLSTHRDNINIIVVSINNCNDIQPLCDLIPDSCRDILAIPKTLIFVDNIDLAKDIAVALRARLPNGVSGIPSDILIRTYWGSIDEEKKKATHSDIKSGRSRITICTDAFGLKVNIKDIQWVIQWDVNEKLSIGSLYQWLERVARNSSLINSDIIYVNKNIL